MKPKPLFFFLYSLNYMCGCKTIEDSRSIVQFGSADRPPTRALRILMRTNLATRKPNQIVNTMAWNNRRGREELTIQVVWELGGRWHSELNLTAWLEYRDIIEDTSQNNIETVPEENK